MQRWHDLLQLLIQVLRDPMWSGIGSICTLVSIPLSIFLARRSPNQRRTTSRRSFKKIYDERRFRSMVQRLLPHPTSAILKKDSVGVTLA